MYGGCLLCPLYPLLHLTNTLLYVTFHRWPEGKYCIYKKGHSCPSRLEEGFVIWDDENKDNKNSKVGDLPEGLYNEDTKIFFCCSTSGSANKEIVLPNKSPFLLFAYDSILCQKVSNWKQTTWPESKLSRALCRRGGKRKESLQLRFRNLNSTSNSPVPPRRLSCQISANQREAETSANVNKHRKSSAKGNDVITNVISANQHFASTFAMQIFKSKDVVASSPSFLGSLLSG